ncbi:MAG: DUF4340 domain-containing protein [Opitutaceae bacterium]|nr:DUF4340 domain-containing protein [Opitutaceae bacterium]
MKLKPLLIVVSLLVVACVAVYYLQRPPPPAAQDVRTQQPLLEAGIAAKAARLRLTDQGKTLLFVRQDDGTWRIPGYFDFAADFSKLTDFVTKFTSTKIERLVTTRPDRMARLEFKDTKIELLDSADQLLWSVTLGKMGDAGGRFLRYGDEPKAYFARLNLWLDLEAKGWADSVLINLKPDDIAKVEVGMTDGGTLVASRARKEDSWTGADAPQGQQLIADKITSLLGNLTPLRFSDTCELNDPNIAVARAHQRTVKLTTFDGKNYTVALGRKPEEKKPKDSATEATATPPSATEDPAAEAKPAEPAYETIPAGPVYVHVTSSDEKAPVSALMQKRAFQVYDYVFTGLPEKLADCWEDKPAQPPPASEAPKP